MTGHKRIFIAAALALGALGTQGFGARAQDADTARFGALEARTQILVAQLAGRPPAAIPNVEEPAPLQRVQDSGALSVRLDRLDSQLRALTGQIEQLQFQQRKLEEQQRKAQADADFRFLELGGKPAPAKQGALSEPPRLPAQAALPAPATVPAALPPLASGPAQPLPGAGRRLPKAASGGDAFDPAAQPNAPGVPRPLGGAAPQGAALPGPAATLPGGPISLSDEPDPLSAPVELGKPGLNRQSGNSGIEPLNPGAAPQTPPVAVLPAPQTTAALPLPAAPADDYQGALASLKQGQYEVAEAALRTYIAKNPRSSRLPDATYYLGETYFQRGRHREAAEQFLKLSTDYSGSTRAPDSLLRLGLSLRAMGANEQACATFGEIARKYPAASPTVRRGAEQEIKRGKC